MHQTQSSSRKAHHLAEHQAIRDLRERDVFNRPKAPPNRLALSPEEAAYDRFQIGVSLRATHGLVEVALELPCAEHSAERGEFCWPSANGLCRSRIGLGKAPGPRAESDHTMRPKHGSSR